MKKSLLKNFSRTLLLLACAFTANYAWADAEASASDVYSVAGNNVDIFGAAWNISETAPTMTLENGIYQWTSGEFVVTNNYGVRYKVVKNHSWENSWGGNYDGDDHNQGYDISSSGRYTMTFFFNPTTSAVYAELHDIFTVAGSSTELFGASWDLNVMANDMTYNGNGIWTWTKKCVKLTAGNIEFKAVKGRDFNYGKWPAGDNYNLNIPSDGVYNVTITLNLNNNEVSVNLDKLLANDATNFPDEEFLFYLSGNYPEMTADGYWSPEELASMVTLSCPNFGIKSLKGIEHFTALANLDCSGNKLTSLDLTSNTALTSLNASNQTVSFENVVTKQTLPNGKNIYFIWLNNQHNGNDPWFCGVIDDYEGVTSNFDLSRVTWGEGCEVYHGTYVEPSQTSLQALSGDIEDSNWIAGDILLVDAVTDNNGSFAYKYDTGAANVSGDSKSLDVNVTWQGSNTITAIDSVNVKSELKAIRYYNMMGVESANPFQGVNIVVTEYTDGSRTTAKVVK